MIRARDLAERLVWTFIAAFLSSLLGAPVVLDVIESVANVTIDISAGQAALISATFAGLTAVGNFLLLIARWRLAVLPNPGEGLPGLPTDDEGQSILVVALVAAGVCLVLLLLLDVIHIR